MLFMRHKGDRSDSKMTSTIKGKVESEKNKMQGFWLRIRM